jgi:hypothetical protein
LSVIFLLNDRRGSMLVVKLSGFCGKVGRGLVECHGSCCSCHFCFKDGLDYGVHICRICPLEAEKAKCCVVLLLYQRVWAVGAAGHGCHIVDRTGKVALSI